MQLKLFILPIKKLAAVALVILAAAPRVHAIMSGGETAFPADSPAARLDPLGNSSTFNAVGALAISSGGSSYYGSGTALSPHWVLTAGHNVDLNNNGSTDPGLSINFNLPGFHRVRQPVGATRPESALLCNPAPHRHSLSHPAR